MNKELEQRFLEAARSVSSVFPTGTFEPSERPDFLLRHPNGALGIEVTELCRREEIEEVRRFTYVAPKAKKLYGNRSGAVPVSVNVVFSPQADDMRVNELAEGLAAFVYERRSAHESFTWDRCEGFPRGYTMIVVSEPLQWDSEPDGYWRSVTGHSRVVAPKELIDRRIAEKNALVPEYRAAVAELWLVIINDVWRGPGEVQVRPDDLAIWSFDFAFDKVLLFSREIGDPSTVVELRRN